MIAKRPGFFYFNQKTQYQQIGGSHGEPVYAETLTYVENLKKAGVEAIADVYHMDMHAFDMLRDDTLSREAIISLRNYLPRKYTLCLQMPQLSLRFSR